MGLRVATSSTLTHNQMSFEFFILNLNYLNHPLNVTASFSSYSPTCMGVIET
jgi:hypothetical protein